MVNNDTRTIGRYAHPSRYSIEYVPTDGPTQYHTARNDAPLAYFFDGKSFSSVNNHHGAVERFSGYGMSVATMRAGKLQQTDWDFARAYVQCEYAFRSVEMVASDISAIKHGVRYRTTKEDWPDHPLMNALAWARRALRQDIISLWEKALYVFGESYLLPISNGFNDPKTGLPYYNGLQWLNPLATEPRIIAGQLQSYDYTAMGMHAFQPSEIVHDKMSSMFDDLRGLSPMAAALAAVNIDIEIKRYTLDSFLKDMRMSGILTGREGSNLAQRDIDAALDVIKQKKESRLIALAPALVWQQVQHEWNDSQFKASDDARRRITTALGIPMSVVGAWDDAHYQSAPAQLEFYYDKVVFRECDRMTTFISDVLMPYFDPWGEGEWYYDKDSVHMPGEDKAAKTNIVNSRQAAGNLTINEAREKLGDPPIEGGDVFVINGQLIPKTALAQLGGVQPATTEGVQTPDKKPEIYEYHITSGVVDKNEVRERLGFPPKVDPDGKRLSDLQAKLTVLQAAVTAGIDLTTAEALIGLIPPAPINPMLPAGTVAPEKAIEPTEQPGVKSAFIGLTFPNHPDLMGLQSRVKELVGAGECQWNDPNDFHITLAYAPAVTDEQLDALRFAIEEVDVPDMALRVGSLGVFDNLGQHAVHFKIRRNADLLTLQAELYDLCAELGIQTSSFSDPAQYKPHITMAYAKDKLPPITFKSALKVKPTAMHLKAGDELLHERQLGVTAVPPDDPEPPAQKHFEQGTDDATIAKIMRKVREGIVAGDSPPRWLDEALRDAWYKTWKEQEAEALLNPDNDWIVAAHMGTREVLGVQPDADFYSTVYVNTDEKEPPAQGKSAPADIVPADEAPTEPVVTVDPVFEQLAEEEGVTELQPLPEENALPPADATTEQVGEAVELALEAQVRAALQAEGEKIGNAILYGEDGPQPGNPLDMLLTNPQTIEAEALDELDAWRKKVKNAGAIKAADTFQNYMIRDEIADKLRDALREAADDKEGQNAAFKHARELIAFKAVQATRVEFEDGFQSILTDALAGKLKRSRWSTLTRSLIGTSINKVYRDGLADGGVLDEPDSDEQAAIDKMVADQSAYVTNLGNTLFKSEDMISDDLAAQKPSMWWNGSIAPAYSAGLLSADANSMFTWVLGNTEKHCVAEGGKWGCQDLAGTTKRLKTWDKLGLNAGTVGQDTTCGGFQCDCKLKRKAAKSSPDGDIIVHTHGEGTEHDKRG